jgi:hypothetical protein
MSSAEYAGPPSRKYEIEVPDTGPAKDWLNSAGQHGVRVRETTPADDDATPGITDEQIRVVSLRRFDDETYGQTTIDMISMYGQYATGAVSVQGNGTVMASLDRYHWAFSPQHHSRSPIAGAP